MTKRELQIAVERRIQLNDATTINENKLSSDAIFAFINEAIDQFWKTRYQGLNVYRTGFEQSQKRIDDLRTLVVQKVYQTADITAENPSYTIQLPDDYAILLGDTVGIAPVGNNDCWEKDSNGQYVVKNTDSLESTIETVDRQLSNSLSEHRLKYCMARPLKLVRDNTVEYITDGTYKVSRVLLNYLRKPSHITTNDNLTEEYTDLPDTTHMEIVKIAVRLYAATKPTQNYQLLAQETQVME